MKYVQCVCLMSLFKFHKILRGILGSEGDFESCQEYLTSIWEVQKLFLVFQGAVVVGFEEVLCRVLQGFEMISMREKSRIK